MEGWREGGKGGMCVFVYVRWKDKELDREEEEIVGGWIVATAEGRR